MTARPGLTRHHTTEALRPPHSHSTQSAPRSTFFSPALATSNISPRRSSPIRSMLGSDLNHGYLYPQRGDGRKRAASLDDLRPSSDAHKAFSAESSVPTDLPFPLPTAVPISSPQSDSGTTNRSKSHGVRRWHTLMELVSTEEGYVKDLKVLVRIYLENLSLVVALEPEARDEIARNADALLTLHKKIYRRLQRVVTEEQLKELGPNKGSIEAQRRVDKAASRVASIFIKEVGVSLLPYCIIHTNISVYVTSTPILNILILMPASILGCLVSSLRSILCWSFTSSRPHSTGSRSP
jgi:hypothetical protein